MSKRMSVVALLGIPLVVAAMVFTLAGVAVAFGERTTNLEGTGQALIYPFWVADGATFTNVEIINRVTPLPLTSQTGARKGRWILVHFIVHEEKNSEDTLDFDVCLSPGDVWSGLLTLQGQTVVLHTDDKSLFQGSPGPIDQPLTPTASNTAPRRGYIEAVMIDNGTTKDQGCDGVRLKEDLSFADGFSLCDGDCGDHAGTSEPLWGQTQFINTGTGISNAIAAEAIEDLEEPDLALGSLNGTIKLFQALGLGEENDAVKGTLMGRFVRDAVLGLDTQVVLTFASGRGHKFNLCSGQSNLAFGFADNTTDCITITQLDFSLSASSQMTLWVRDDEECVNASPRLIPIPQEVNVFNFSALPNSLFHVFGPNCIGGKDAKGGWFRLLFDANQDEITDAVSGVIDLDDDTSTTNDQVTVKAPRVIPAVGGVFLTGGTATGARLSTFLPFRTERPHDSYGCNAIPPPPTVGSTNSNLNCTD